MSAPLRVLHVEDSLTAVAVVRAMIGSHVNLVSVPTLAEARKLVAHQPFDVLLLDTDLPDSVGLATLQTFSPCFIPTIVVSKDESLQARRAAEALGVADYITKANLGKINLLSHIKMAHDKYRIDLNDSSRGRWVDAETFEKVKPYIAC